MHIKALLEGALEHPVFALFSKNRLFNFCYNFWYEGGFCDNMKHGYGVYQWADGE